MASEKQLDLIDVAHPADKEIKLIAEKIKAHDRDRSDAQEKASEARGDLIAMMKKHGIRKWAKGEIQIERTVSHEKVSVKVRPADDSGE